jgi:hypothetical protein
VLKPSTFIDQAAATVDVVLDEISPRREDLTIWLFALEKTR